MISADSLTVVADSLLGRGQTMVVSVKNLRRKYQVSIYASRNGEAVRETAKKIREYFDDPEVKQWLQYLFLNKNLGPFKGEEASFILVGEMKALNPTEKWIRHQTSWLRKICTVFEAIQEEYGQVAQSRLKRLRKQLSECGISLGMTSCRLTAHIGPQKNEYETLDRVLKRPLIEIEKQEEGIEEAPEPRSSPLGKRSRDPANPKPLEKELRPEETPEPRSSALGKRSRDPADPKPLEKEPQQTEGAKIRPKNWKPKFEEEPGIERQVQQKLEVVEESDRDETPAADEDWCPDLARVFAREEELFLG